MACPRQVHARGIPMGFPPLFCTTGLCNDIILTVLGFSETLQMSQYLLLWFYKMTEASHPKQRLQKTGWMQIKPLHQESQRRKSCTPLSTETHPTQTWNKAYQQLLADRVHTSPLWNTLFLCLLQTLKSCTRLVIPCRHVNLCTWVLKERFILEVKINHTNRGTF